MKKLLAIGTSHTTDAHRDQEWHNDDCLNGYVDLKAGELPWTGYLAQQLGMHHDTVAIGGLGIDTYFARLVSNFDNHDYVLIEMPSINRYELYLNESNLGQSLQKEFWKDGAYKDFLYSYNVSDAKLSSEDIRSLKKFNRVNKKSELPLLEHEVELITKLSIKYNESMIFDASYCKMLMINEWIKSKGAIPVWFNWNFATEQYLNYDFTGFYIVNTMWEGAVTMRERLRYDYNLSPKIFNNKCPSLLPDGTHLSSKLWRQEVDNYFVPFMEKLINAKF